MALRLSLVAAIVAVVATFSVAGVRALRDEEGSARLGLNTHLVWAPGGSVEPVLAEIRNLGISLVREEFPWRLIEPEQGRFDWRQTDALMEAASRRGVDVLGILAYSAPWASADPGGDDHRYPPRDPADYARYAAAVVQRYGPAGSFWA